MKKCSKCEEVKSDSEFNKNSSKKDGLSAYCRDCNKETLKEHYQSNKQQYRDRKKKQREKKRKFINDIKLNGKCSRCPEDDIACLDFHHKEDFNKEFNISKAISDNLSLNKIKKEIDKCELICSNCHRKIHYYAP